MDATMKRSRVGSLVAVAVSLAMIPALWVMAFDAIPTLQTVQADQSGGRMGPWVFTWGLVWIATIACLVVSALCYASLGNATMDRRA